MSTYQKLVQDEKNHEIYENIKKYKNDFENKVLWLIKAEEKGDIFAQITLASYYEIKGNEKKAFYLYKKPVIEQHAQYIIDIANSYYALKDVNNALLWYKKSAHLGNIDSIKFLISFYEKIKEFKKMEYWLKKMRDIDPVNAEILSEKINMNHTEEQAKISYLQSVKNNDQILLLCNTSPAGFIKISRNKDTYKINIYKNDTILVDYTKNYKNTTDSNFIKYNYNEEIEGYSIGFMFGYFGPENNKLYGITTGVGDEISFDIDNVNILSCINNSNFINNLNIPNKEQIMEPFYYD